MRKIVQTVYTTAMKNIVEIESDFQLYLDLMQTQIFSINQFLIICLKTSAGGGGGAENQPVFISTKGSTFPNSD